MFKQFTPVRCRHPICTYLNDTIVSSSMDSDKNVFGIGNSVRTNLLYIDFIRRDIERGVCMLIVKRELRLDDVSPPVLYVDFF